MTNDKFHQWRVIGACVSIPFLLGVCPLLGYFLGEFLEEIVGGKGWLRFVFLALGFGAGAKTTWELVKKTMK